MDQHRRLWDAWSDDFQAAWNAETAAGELPPALIHYGPGFPEARRREFLPDLTGRDVIELGCGGGQASVGFARTPTDRVVGVDLSAVQLGHARELRDSYEADAEFVAGSVTDLPVGTTEFDLAFSSRVFQMVPDLGGAFAEAARVLRPGGRFVFAVPHPFYQVFDPETHDPVRSYFGDEPARKSIGGVDVDLLEFPHRIGDYHAALVDAGFVVDRLFEPGSDDPEYYEEDMSYKPALMANVPPTLVMRAVKRDDE